MSMAAGEARSGRPGSLKILFLLRKLNACQVASDVRKVHDAQILSSASISMITLEAAAQPDSMATA
jgi:hypothetical protein